MKIVTFQEPSKNWLGKLLEKVGIVLTKKQKGYLHTLGYSGKQKIYNQKDLVIIEKESGHIVTIPNKKKYYAIQ